MNVLVIAPHPDDEAIGCGGTISLHNARNDRVSVVFLSSGEAGLKHLAPEEAWRVREREAEAAADVLGVAATHFLRRPDWFVGDSVAESTAPLRAVLGREHAQRIYLPHPREWHPDHQAALPVLRSALGAGGGGPDAPEVWTYEVWTPLQEYDRVENVTTTMSRKLRAVRCYGSQLAGFRYDRAVRGLNQYRGALTVGCRFAEVFQAVAAD